MIRLCITPATRKNPPLMSPYRNGGDVGVDPSVDHRGSQVTKPMISPNVTASPTRTTFNARSRMAVVILATVPHRSGPNKNRSRLLVGTYGLPSAAAYALPNSTANQTKPRTNKAALAMATAGQLIW